MCSVESCDLTIKQVLPPVLKNFETFRKGLCLVCCKELYKCDIWSYSKRGNARCIQCGCKSVVDYSQIKETYETLKCKENYMLRLSNKICMKIDFNTVNDLIFYWAIRYIYVDKDEEDFAFLEEEFENIQKKIKKLHVEQKYPLIVKKAIIISNSKKIVDELN